MNKHLLILGIAVLLICVGLSGCFEEKSGTYTSWEDDLEKDAGRQHNNTLFVEWIENNMPIMEMYNKEIDKAAQSEDYSATLYWANLEYQKASELREEAYNLKLTPSYRPLRVNYSSYLLEIYFSSKWLINGTEAILDDNWDSAEFFLRWSRESYDRSVEYLENVKYLIKKLDE